MLAEAILLFGKMEGKICKGDSPVYRIRAGAWTIYKLLTPGSESSSVKGTHIRVLQVEDDSTWQYIERKHAYDLVLFLFTDSEVDWRWTLWLGKPQTSNPISN